MTDEIRELLENEQDAEYEEVRFGVWGRACVFVCVCAMGCTGWGVCWSRSIDQLSG